MARLLGIDIPDKKHIVVALTYIYGIGPTRAREILKLANIDFQRKVQDLTREDLNNIKKIIEAKKFKIEGDLRREQKANIKRLIEINSYRGMRHIRKLPVRGQRTKTNSRTRRGNVKRTVGSGRRKAPSPT